MHIGGGAFRDTGLRTLTRPATVRKVGTSAFARCDDLETVLVPHGLEVNRVSQFKGCRKLKEILRY